MKLLKVIIPKVWEWQGMLSGNRIKDIISTRGCKKSVGGRGEKGPGLIYCESLLLQLLQPRWPETKLAKAKVDQFRSIQTKYVKTRTSVNNAKDGLDQLFLMKKGIAYMNVITMGQSTTIFCALTHFRDGDKHPFEQPANWVILEQACSWSVRRQSFAKLKKRLLSKQWKS